MSLAWLPGAPDARRPRAPDPPARAGRRPRPRDRVPAQRRGDRRAQARPPGPDRARARGGDGLLQDPPATPSCSSPTCPRTPTSATTSSATSRRRCPSATRRRCAATGCDARSSRRSSPTSSSTGPGRRSRSASREETGAPASLLARALRRRAGGLRHARRSGTTWRHSTIAVDAEAQLTMLIEARKLVERATRWLVRNNARSIDIAATTAYYARGAAMLSGALPDVLDGADRDAFEARVSELEEAGVPPRAGGPRRGHAVAARRCSTSSRSPRATMRRARGRDRDPLRPRVAARAQLAARPDPRAAARQPLAGAGPRRAARRPLQPAPLAHPGGAGGGRPRRRQRGRDRAPGRIAAAPRSSAAWA